VSGSVQVNVCVDQLTAREQSSYGIYSICARLVCIEFAHVELACGRVCWLVRVSVEIARVGACVPNCAECVRECVTHQMTTPKFRSRAVYTTCAGLEYS